MRSRSLIAISASALLVTSTALVTASTSSAAPAADRSAHQRSTLLRLVRHQREDAAAYVVPDDVTQVWSSRRPDGATQTRYQQSGRRRLRLRRPGHGHRGTPPGATDVGRRRPLPGPAAQQHRQGQQGARPAASSRPRSAPAARSATSCGSTRAPGGYFYQVQSLRADAASGPLGRRRRPAQTIKAFDALTEGAGIGVKGDTKTIDTTQNAGRRLYRAARPATTARRPTTCRTPAVRDRRRADDRRRRRLEPQPGLIASPSQAAGVDAHYYAGVVDDFYGDDVRPQQHRRPGHEDRLEGPLRPGLLQRLLERAVHDLRRRRRHAPACRCPAASTWTATS